MSALAETLTNKLDDEIARLTERIPLRNVPTLLPRCRCGKRVHVATLFRWTSRGCRGVRLRFEQVGATRCTTREWLAEFFDALTRRSQPEEISTETRPTPATACTPAARLRAIAKADAELARMGV
jgi:hypothetical protein